MRFLLRNVGWLLGLEQEKISVLPINTRIFVQLKKIGQHLSKIHAIEPLQHNTVEYPHMEECVEIRHS